MNTLLSIAPPPTQQHKIDSLPVAVLHVHSKCNCRCVMCDIWQTKEVQELSGEGLARLLTSFHKLKVRWVVLTGGEPLLHSDLPGICAPLREAGIRVTLLTTGLLLSRYAETSRSLFDEIIVSIDGPPGIHDQIRRVPRGFQKIEEGLRLVHDAAPDLPLRARTTVQRSNRLHLRETVMTAKRLPLDSISFLAADLTSEAFNRKLIWPVERQNEVGLSVQEVVELEQEIEKMMAEFDEEITTGFISESPAKLRRIVQHFRGHLGLAEPVAPVCNAPWSSTVVELDGSVRPCFFHQPIGNIVDGDLEQILNGGRGLEFRNSLDIASNPTCRRCVCSLNYREG